jgi:hypothetical protein
MCTGDPISEEKIQIYLGVCQQSIDNDLSNYEMYLCASETNLIYKGFQDFECTQETEVFEMKINTQCDQGFMIHTDKNLPCSNSFFFSIYFNFSL